MPPDRQLITPRELEVARLIADGMSNRVIAERLGCAPQTVQHHLNHMYWKLGATGSAHMVAILFRKGILT
jgi:DNA-binding CsgD family transcriptional regulator